MGHKDKFVVPGEELTVRPPSEGDEEELTEEEKAWRRREAVAALEAQWVAETETKKDYSKAKREEYAEKGWALPDGSYPIADRGDVQDAVAVCCRSKNHSKSRVKAHILKRAKALGAMDAVPDKWK